MERFQDYYAGFHHGGHGESGRMKHGFEVAVFEGAARVLERTSLIVVEAYNFELTETCLRSVPPW